MNIEAPRVLFMLWSGPHDADGEAQTSQEAMEFALASKKLYLTEEEAIEDAKEVAGELRDSGGECSVYRCVLTLVGTASAREADYEATGDAE